MKRHFRILVGATVGLTFTPAPLPAFSQDARPLAAPIILAQDLPPEEEELLRRKKRKGAEGQEQQQAPRAEKPRRERAERQEAPAAEEQVPRRKERETARQRQAEPDQPAVAEERIKRRKERETARQRQAEPDQPAIAEERIKRRKERETARQRQAQPDQPAIAEERIKRRKEREAARQRQAQPDQPAIAEERIKRRKEREAARQRQAQPDQPAIAEERIKRRTEREAARQRQAQPDEPDIAEEERLRRRDKRQAARPTENENATQFFDSAKEKRRKLRRGEPEQAAEDQPGEDQPATAEARRLPESDAEAQVRRARTDPVQVGSITTEEGRRIERPRRERPEVPEGAEFVREVNNRFIFQTNNTYFIERPREERFFVDARDFYYEELPRSRQREVIVRPDGTRIVTIRNRWGDVIRRVKILPDNREFVLVYVEDDYYDDVLEWRDPGLDLPPLVLDIPVDDYILDAEYVEDPEDYYTFLDQPPVEQVERTYSIDEVRRSARIRDKVRRIDLDIINFEFGSATIPESEIEKLEGVAEAMQRLLKENPGETFFIEGHTDAVGSEVANLALSDQRAEAVATALTNVFEIPPENMETQGYGEQYLKVETEEPERENRRVAIRRITPLVAPAAPVAQAE
jgi:outer membrane protein OmpA-like peptidoglycan-associated protein